MGHGAKVKAKDQTPEVLNKEHNYLEGSWRLVAKIIVLVSPFGVFFDHFADEPVGSGCVSNICVYLLGQIVLGMQLTLWEGLQKVYVGQTEVCLG